MRKATALLLGVLLPLLGLPEIGQAQSSVQIQGTIEAVDCQGQTFVLGGAGGTNTVAAEAYTPVLINSASVPFCALQQYIGAPATVWLVASGSQFVATRIDVVGEAAVIPPPPPVEAEVASDPLPIAGIVLGTIIVARLLYLLAHDHDGGYYRYPYYGPYYRHYYRAEYRAFAGPYPRLAPIITPPPTIRGVILGTTAVDGLAYLVARDREGRFSRYPYYGPYHRYYYRPEYHPYQGRYNDAPVRQADLRWDRPAYRDPRNQVPQWTPPPYQNGAPSNPNWGPPGYPNDPRRNVPAYNDPRNQVPQWTPPPHQNGAPPNPNWGPPGYPNDPRRNVPAYNDPRNQVPQWTAPPHQNGAPPNPNWGPPGYPNDPRRNIPAYNDPRNQVPQRAPQWTSPPSQGDRRQAPGNDGSRPQCGGPASNHPCPADNGDHHR